MRVSLLSAMVLILLLGLCWATAVAGQGAPDHSVECFDTEQFSGGEILGLFHTEVGVWLATREGAYRLVNERFEGQLEGDTKAILDVGNGQVLIGTSRGLWKWRDGGEGVEPVLQDISVHVLTRNDTNTVWVGGDTGLFLLDWNRPSSSLKDVLSGADGVEESVLSMHTMREITQATFSGREPIYEGLELLVGTNQSIWGIYSDGEARRLMRYPLGKSAVNVVSNGQDTFAIFQRSLNRKAPVSLLVPEASRSGMEEHRFEEEDAFGKDIGLALELVTRPGAELPEIWFGREHGLSAHSGGLASEALLLNKKVYSILSFDGRVFIGTEDGLQEGRLRGKPNALVGPPAYLEELDDTGGLFRLVQGKGTDFPVYEVIESDGKIWFRSGRRLCGYQVEETVVDEDAHASAAEDGDGWSRGTWVGIAILIALVIGALRVWIHPEISLDKGARNAD